MARAILWMWLLCCLLSSVAEAGFVVSGFTLARVAPTLPGGTTTGICNATNPVTGDEWWSDSRVLYRADGKGGWAESIAIPWVTSDLVFDSEGRMYVNDFGTGHIYRTEADGEFHHWAFGPRWPRDMKFDAAGNLVVIGANGVPYQDGLAWRISPDGEVSIWAVTQGESFDFDAAGDMIIPLYGGNGIDRLTADGTLTPIFRWKTLDDNGNVDFSQPFAGLFESIAVTAGGNYVLGLNTGTEEGNSSSLIRVDGQTGQRVLLGTDIDDAIPVDLAFAADGDLVYTGFGSLHALTAAGDFDAPLGVPTPPVWLLASGLAAALLWSGRAHPRWSEKK